MTTTTLNRIEQLRRMALPLEPDVEQRVQWREQVIQYTDAFLENLPNLPAFRVTEDEGVGILDSDRTSGGPDSTLARRRHDRTSRRYRSHRVRNRQGQPARRTSAARLNERYAAVEPDRREHQSGRSFDLGSELYATSVARRRIPIQHGPDRVGATRYRTLVFSVQGRDARTGSRNN